jgi:hypothetical protein
VGASVVANASTQLAGNTIKASLDGQNSMLVGVQKRLELAEVRNGEGHTTPDRSYKESSAHKLFEKVLDRMEKESWVSVGANRYYNTFTDQIWNKTTALIPIYPESLLVPLPKIGFIFKLLGRWGGKAAAKEGSSWIYGAFKSEAKWAGQLSKRGWTVEQITEAVTKGKNFSAVNMVNKANAATRYVHPRTGQSVVIDNVTKELLHVGGPGFKY